MSANIFELKSKLKPCPFCGRKAKTYCTPELECRDGEKVIGVLSKVFSVFCVCTQADVQAETAEKAAEKWNRRVPGWFSVDKVLPLNRKHVIGFDAEGRWVYPWLYFHSDTKEFLDELDDDKLVKITHWMPFPEAPWEESDNE
jgi:hypothetical protein